MASPLSTSDVSARIRDVLESNFDTHKADVASGIEPIRTIKAGPVTSRAATPAVQVYFVRTESKYDSPQSTGEDRVEIYQLDAVVEIATLDETETAKVEQFGSALDYSLKKESQLLDPDSGEKLQWLGEIWPIDMTIEYRSGGGRKLAGVISIQIRATIFEAESY